MIVRRPVLPDLYVDGDRCAAFAADQVVVLSEFATSILLGIPEGGDTTVADITARVLEEFGPPEPPLDPATVVTAQVVALSEHGILALDAAEGGEGQPA